MQKNKVILLGLDGATWNQIDRFVSKSKTPNLHKLISNGSRTILQSHVPFSSNSCWLSILTGLNPGKHGVPHHAIGNKVEVPTLYEILDKNNLRQIIINDMANYPPLKINGIMISGGFATPFNSKNFVHPLSFLSKINSLVGDYKPMLPPNTVDSLKQGKIDEFLIELKKLGDNIVKLSNYFSETENWQMLSTFLINTDYINHLFWGNDSRIEEFYDWLDSVIGIFLEIADKNNANIFVVSDHGGGQIRKHFLINPWLEREGFSTFAKSSQVRNLLSKTKFKRKFVRNTLDSLHLRGAASKILPETVKKMVPIAENETGFIQKESKIFSEAYNEITVNIDDPKEYEKTRELIIKKLTELRDDDGTKIVKKVLRKEESFPGPYTDRAFDLQYILNEGYGYSPLIREEYLLTPQELESVFKGDHRPEGIFLAYGPDIKKNQEIEDIKLWDVAPTILHCLGCPIPENIEGEVTSKIFKKNLPIIREKKSEGLEREFVKTKLKNIVKKI